MQGICRLVLGLSILFPAAAFAQSRLDCPRPVRERSYRNAPKPYLELSAGFSRPLLYRNAAGSAGENFSFISRLTPYGAVIAYLPLSARLSIFGGASVTQTWQGLRFRYEDNSGSMEWKSYAGSTVITIPLGLRYMSSERLLLSAGPYLAYAAHNGEGSGGNGVSGYSYAAPDFTTFNFGLRLAADIPVTTALGISLSCSADAQGSARSTGRADFGQHATRVYEGRMDPHLLHAAFGISYRFPAHNRE